MMAGVLISSITSGNLISKTGRYKPFPIIGTAVAALGMILLSRLAVSTPLWLAALYLLVLGLGLGMVMQVLVLAAQNAVPYQMLGVATSGSTLFRQIGGAVGVSIFGAIFANRLATELAERTTCGRPRSRGGEPRRSSITSRRRSGSRSSKRSRRRSHRSSSPRPGSRSPPSSLTWLLREVPLRETAAAEGIGESFAAPREDRSDRELERIISSIASGRMRTEIVPTDRRRVSRGTHTRRGMAARPPRHQSAPWSTFRRKATTPEEVAGLTAELIHRGYLTIEPAGGRLELSERGRQANAALVEAGRAVLTRIACRHRPARGGGRRHPAPPRDLTPGRHPTRCSPRAARECARHRTFRMRWGVGR